MNRYVVSNEEETISVEVWAFDHAHAVERVQKLTDSNEFRKVKDVNTIKLSHTNDVVDDIFD